MGEKALSCRRQSIAYLPAKQWSFGKMAMVPARKGMVRARKSKGRGAKKCKFVPKE
jgi:hypothetical protein